MTRLRGRWTAAVSLLLLAGCADTTADSAVPGLSPGAAGTPPAGEAPVLQIRSIGGFVPAATNVTRLPLVSVYADGQVITEGPQIEIYPAPALPNVQVSQISAAAVDTLVAQAVAAGVTSGADLGDPPVADIPTTRFTVVTGTGTHSVDVKALSVSAPDLPGLTTAQRAGRAKLLALQRTLTQLPLGSEPPAAGTSAAPVTSRAYLPTTLAAVAHPYVAADVAGISAAPAVPWPGPALPGAPMGEGLELGCVAVSGADLAPVLAAARTANTTTAWSSGGKQWAVTFRPLLPEETDCADLAAGR